mgnify:CR=1 FL=1
MKTNVLACKEEVKIQPTSPSRILFIRTFVGDLPDVETQPVRSCNTVDINSFYEEAAERLCKRNDPQAYVRAMSYYERAREL